MSEISIILAWTIIPLASFMVLYVVREIWASSKESNSESNLESTLHNRAFHSNHRRVGY
jgi:hypothetical protein